MELASHPKMIQSLKHICKENAKASSFLINTEGNAPVPLKKIDLQVSIQESIASYVMTQHYVNIEENPLETAYLFPMDVKAVISKLTC